MNIVFLADIVPYPPNTGIKIRTYNIIKQLFMQGNNVYLLCFNHRIFISDEKTLQDCIVELNNICSEVHIFQIPSENNLISKYALYLKSIFSKEPYRVARYYSEECVDKINDIMDRIVVDLVHLDKVEFFKYNDLFREKPLFATNHNIESDLMRQRVDKEINCFRKFFAFLQWKKTERYEEYALNAVSGYVTCSDEDALFFKNKLNVHSNQITVENGVDCEFYLPKPDITDEGYFLIIGAQNRESTANFDATQYFFNEIWPLLKNSQINIKIVGRNPDVKIIELAKREKHVEVLGFVDDEREVFLKARALLVPLRIGGGSRLKILTAFGLGKTVISTSKGAEGIHCEDGSNVLIGDSPERFAEHMVNLAGKGAIAKQIGNNARKVAVSKYDWRILCKKLSDFYRICIDIKL